MQKTSLSGSRLFQGYKISKVLGQGSFGTVLKCENRLDTTNYAIKVTGDASDSIKEIENLVKVPQHENVVQYITCWKDKISKSELDSLESIPGYSNVNTLSLPTGLTSLNVICIQMELCGQDLRSWLAAQTIVNEQNVMEIFIQVVRGIEHIHNHNLIHRDLKPENIFMGISNPLIAKIGDLGAGIGHKSTNSATHTASVGTKIYFAPEQFGNQYGKTVDIYALGIILFELLNPSIQPAANNNSTAKLVSAINELKFKQTLPINGKSKWPLASQLILKMTSVSTKDRPTYSEIFGTFGSGSTSSRTSSASPIPPTRPQATRSGTTRPVHLNIGCDGCGANNIPGVRYKCSICSDYDLCETCEKRAGLHPSDHVLFKIKEPQTQEQNLAILLTNILVSSMLEGSQGQQPEQPTFNNPPAPLTTGVKKKPERSIECRMI